MLRTLRILFSNRKTSTHPAIWPRKEDLGKADLKARAGVPERAREPDLGDGTQKETNRGPRTFPDSGSEASLAAIRARVDGVDWTEVHADLDAQGWAIVPKLLTDAEVQFGDVHGGAVAAVAGDAAGHLQTWPPTPRAPVAPCECLSQGQ